MYQLQWQRRNTLLLMLIHTLCTFSQTYKGDIANSQHTVTFTNDGKFDLTIRRTSVSDDVFGYYIKNDEIIICYVDSSLNGFLIKDDSIKYQIKNDKLLIYNRNGDIIKHSSLKLFIPDHSIMLKLPKEVEARVIQYILKMQQENSQLNFAGYLQHTDDEIYKYCLFITKKDVFSFFYKETNRFLNIDNIIIPLAFDYDKMFGKAYPRYSDEFGNRMQIRDLFSDDDFQIFFDSTGKYIK
jgi:hypothetical protein